MLEGDPSWTNIDAGRASRGDHEPRERELGSVTRHHQRRVLRAHPEDRLLVAAWRLGENEVGRMEVVEDSPRGNETKHPLTQRRARPHEVPGKRG